MKRLNKYLIIFLRLILGAVFLWASFDKIIDPASFAKNISNYHVVPFGLENTVAIILPWLEFFIGTGMILGIMVNGSIIISSFLLILFNILIAQAILRGFNIECGCGLKDGQMVGIEKILENFVLLGFAYILNLRDKKIFELFPKTNLSDK
tara:strand:- start:668 stop:1120 length:453 start_codon:yes stop_codon:yes gene_type:complete